MPKISVIIPVYNVEQYLPQCLDSLRKQTLSDLEFICINDGSVDGSLDILQAYAAEDHRFVIINQNVLKLSRARVFQDKVCDILSR